MLGAYASFRSMQRAAEQERELERYRSVTWSGNLAISDPRLSFRITSVDDAEHLALNNRGNAHTQALLASQVPLSDIRPPGDNARAAYKYDSCYGCGAPPRSGGLCDYCGREH